MSIKELENQIKQIRPHIMLVSPLVARIFLTYAAFNILVGSYLFLGGGDLTNRVPIVGPVFDLQFHGVFFTLLGLLKLYSYFTNNWRLMKGCLLFGLALKTMWLIALGIMVIKGSNPLVMYMWLFLTIVQALCYIHFVPSGRRAGDE